MFAAIGAVLFLAAGLTPAKGWFAPAQPVNVAVKVDGPSTLVLTDFSGRVLDPRTVGANEVAGDATVNLRDVFVAVQTPNTYVLYLTKKRETPEELLKQGVPADLVEKARNALAMRDGPPAEFFGTPLVVSVREDRRRGAPTGPMVVRVEPLRYAVMSTAHGPVTMGFYYDVAPNTVNNFLSLAEEGYFDGLTFHRIVPGFVIQGGDPRGDGTGGPGYMIDAEFSQRRHEPGVLSMARSGDPGEAPGVMPRAEFANSAASQFFVCLDYENTKQLDGKYTVFGKVTAGMEVVERIAAAPLADERSGKPRDPQVIQRVEVKAVTQEGNPYAQIFRARDVTKEGQKK